MESDPFWWLVLTSSLIGLALSIAAGGLVELAKSLLAQRRGARAHSPQERSQ